MNKYHDRGEILIDDISIPTVEIEGITMATGLNVRLTLSPTKGMVRIECAEALRRVVKQRAKQAICE